MEVGGSGVRATAAWGEWRPVVRGGKGRSSGANGGWWGEDESEGSHGRMGGDRSGVRAKGNPRRMGVGSSRVRARGAGGEWRCWGQGSLS